MEGRTGGGKEGRRRLLLAIHWSNRKRRENKFVTLSSYFAEFFMQKEEHILCSMCVFVSLLLFLISWKCLLGNGYYIIYCRAYIKNQASISIKCSKANCSFFFSFAHFYRKFGFYSLNSPPKIFCPTNFLICEIFPVQLAVTQTQTRKFPPSSWQGVRFIKCCFLSFSFSFFYPPSIPCGQTVQSKLHLFAALVSKTVLLHRPEMLA